MRYMLRVKREVGFTASRLLTNICKLNVAAKYNMFGNANLVYQLLFLSR